MNRKAARQPYLMAIGPARSGATTPPSVPPLNDSAIARARLLAGSDSTAVRKPPGNVTPSPKPSSARPSQTPSDRVIHPCDTLATVQMPTAHQHADAQADVVQNRSPDRVREGVGEKK